MSKIQNVFVSMVDTFDYYKIMFNRPATIISFTLHGKLYPEETDFFLVLMAPLFPEVVLCRQCKEKRYHLFKELEQSKHWSAKNAATNKVTTKLKK